MDKSNISNIKFDGIDYSDYPDYKICSKCKVQKPLTDFSKDKYTKTGTTYQCKKCRNNYIKNNPLTIIRRKEYKLKNRKRISQSGKEYYAKTKERTRERHRVWYINNKEKQRELTREWASKNKEKISNYTKNSRSRINKRQRERIKNDSLYKLRRNLSSRITSCFRVKSWRKNGITEGLLGCSYQEASIHIESKFKLGMNWNNNTRDGWHIDHIIPLSSAKTEDELRKLCHYTNLQPLWAKENIVKSNKI